MRILVTRTQPEAQRTAARLAALGHEALLAPLVSIVATDATLPERPFDAVLATSAQAIALLRETRGLHDLPIFTVGARTAAAARAAGFSGVRAPAPDARRLAETIAAFHPAPAAFLYLAGRDRKPDLEATLGQSGHRIEVVVTYAAKAAVVLPQDIRDALARGEIDAILHYSRRSAAIFRALAEAAGVADAAGRALHVCISADAAAPLQGFASRLRAAVEPNETALLAELASRRAP